VSRSVVVMAVLLAALIAAGCTGPRTAAPPSGAATGTPEKPAEAGVKAIAAETEAEKGAVAAAATPVGRKWAAGNPNGSVEAQGDPFLVGYDVTLYDGATQYLVTVIGGVGVPFFGKSGQKAVDSPKDDYNTPMAAATTRQKAALAAAVDYIKDIAPGAQPGGIANYVVYFPTEPGPSGYIYQGVSIFANPADAASVFAMGGTQNR